MTDSDGRWTPPPEIPGSVRSLKRLLDECRKKNVAMYDVVMAVRTMNIGPLGSSHLDTCEDFKDKCRCGLGRLLSVLKSYDKAMEKDG